MTMLEVQQQLIEHQKAATEAMANAQYALGKASVGEGLTPDEEAALAAYYGEFGLLVGGILDWVESLLQRLG